MRSYDCVWKVNMGVIYFICVGCGVVVLIDFDLGLVKFVIGGYFEVGGLFECSEIV